MIRSNKPEPRATVETLPLRSTYRHAPLADTAQARQSRHVGFVYDYKPNSVYMPIWSTGRHPKLCIRLRCLRVELWRLDFVYL